jgi:hypothetical protein
VKRRAVALLAAATLVAILGVGGGTVASAVTTRATISIGSQSIVPGQKLLISGSGWPVKTALSATLCGTDAIAGTADCAETTTVVVVAPRTGRVWAMMTTALPPVPCPCVILVTGITNLYTKKIPVTVVGAATAPVTRTTTSGEPDLRVANLRVVGGTTWASSFGGAAPRTLEFRVHNAGTGSETPVLLGRWGTGAHPTNVIKMPVMRALGAGQSTEVRAHFSLSPLSTGTYTVRVDILTVGFHEVASASSSTSTWPIALFIVGLVLLGLVLWGVSKIVLNRWRRTHEKEGVASEEELPAVAAGALPEHYNGLMALGAKVAAAGPAGVTTGEGYDPNDPTTQLE